MAIGEREELIWGIGMQSGLLLQGGIVEFQSIGVKQKGTNSNVQVTVICVRMEER